MRQLTHHHFKTVDSLWNLAKDFHEKKDKDKKQVSTRSLTSMDISRSDLAFHLNTVATISVAQVLESYQFKPEIKLLNDVLLDGKKVCGIGSCSE